MALRELVDDLRALVPLAVVGARGVPEPYERVKMAIDAMKNDPVLDTLSPEELRALTTFKITLYRAASMEADQLRKHIGAVWRGMAHQAILKMPTGKECEDAMHDLMQGGIG
jgi:hypothetical protein